MKSPLEPKKQGWNSLVDLQKLIDKFDSLLNYLKHHTQVYGDDTIELFPDLKLLLHPNFWSSYYAYHYYQQAVTFVDRDAEINVDKNQIEAIDKIVNLFEQNINDVVAYFPKRNLRVICSMNRQENKVFIVQKFSSGLGWETIKEFGENDKKAINFAITY